MAAIGFIVPAFNAATTLEATLRSLQAQTLRDWLAIVVDDGSTDGTAGVALDFAGDSRIRLVRQENRGLSGARNRGIEACEGESPEAICFLDADDVVAPEFVERLLPALVGSGSAGPFDLATCWYRMAGPGLEDLDWVVRTGDHDVLPARMIEYNPCAVGAVVVRSSLARSALVETPYGPGLFQTSLSVHEDWDAWLRLSAPPPLGFGARWAPVVPEALFCYRLRHGSMSGSLERMWRVGLAIIERAPVEAELKPGARRRWSLRHMARAAARGDEALVAACYAAVEPLRGAEHEFIAGCLRWALCQQEQVGPGQVDADRAARWRHRLAELLGEIGSPVLAHLHFEAGDGWAEVVERMCRGARDGARPVIYGMGRNGRDLLAVLERAQCDLPLAWMDDDPAAAVPVVRGEGLERLSIDDLSASHLIVVTPDEHSGIVAGLRSRGLEKILVRKSGPDHP